MRIPALVAATLLMTAGAANAASLWAVYDSAFAHARYIAICPPDWKYGTTPSAEDAPLPRSAHPLRWDVRAGARVR